MTRKSSLLIIIGLDLCATFVRSQPRNLARMSADRVRSDGDTASTYLILPWRLDSVRKAWHTPVTSCPPNCWHPWRIGTRTSPVYSPLQSSWWHYCRPWCTVPPLRWRHIATSSLVHHHHPALLHHQTLTFLRHYSASLCTTHTASDYFSSFMLSLMCSCCLCEISSVERDDEVPYCHPTSWWCIHKYLTTLFNCFKDIFVGGWAKLYVGGPSVLIDHNN